MTINRSAAPVFTEPWEDWRKGHAYHCALWLDPVNYDCSCGVTQARGRVVRLWWDTQKSGGSMTKENSG